MRMLAPGGAGRAGAEATPVEANEPRGGAAQCGAEQSGATRTQQSEKGPSRCTALCAYEACARATVQCCSEP